MPALFPVHGGRTGYTPDSGDHVVHTLHAISPRTDAAAAARDGVSSARLAIQTVVKLSASPLRAASRFSSLSTLHAPHFYVLMTTGA
eukprot:6170415-Pleurochrysis_carterae.AAC.2